MAVQDDHMIRNIQDVGRLIAKLLLHEQQPNYKLPEKEADYTEADRLFATIMKLAEEGKINEAENELYMGMVEDGSRRKQKIIFYMKGWLQNVKTKYL